MTRFYAKMCADCRRQANYWRQVGDRRREKMYRDMAWWAFSMLREGSA